MKHISRTVWILSLVSMFTDTASEMLYPVMPIYLKSIGFSVLFIGILEGIAEATAGLSKAYFGKLSDASEKRLPFVQAGYALSAISKPMMALLRFPVWVFFSRTLDRLGKGIRTGARDAMLSEEATPETKGKVFGFHRSMDTLGAVLGPAIALVFLYFHPNQYNFLFFIAFLPGFLAIVASFLLNDKTRPESKQIQKFTFFSSFKYWRESSIEYRKLLGGLLFFALMNSSDVFLLLKAKESGLGDTQVIAVYIFYNLVYALSAFPLGILADRVGLRKMFMFGVAIFATVYICMGFQTNFYMMAALFFMYGIYAAATEGISKAWISNISEKQDVATAIGTYSGFQSIATMFSSSIAGLVWYNFGAAKTFLISGIGAVLVLVYFMLNISNSKK